ncbi:MAG: hypothetical protein IJL69_04190 [Oscillospiraceae bacterium]|nr:hypothetical protein [Oscillospiraceae bacterium]
MTYGELLDAALAVLEQTDRASREPFAPAMIDLVLAELFGIEQELRAAAGKAPLNAVPRCTDLSAGIPYEDELVVRDMVLGLVCRLAADEEDPALHNYYAAEYALARREHTDRGGMRVADVYS